MKINGNPDGGGGGAAVWGGITGNINSQTDLINKFNTQTTSIQTWVEGQDYVSDPDGILETVENTDKGVLYTDQIDSMTTSFKKDTNISYVFNGLYQIGDDVYYYYDYNLCKFNKDTWYFDRITGVNLPPVYGLWKDDTGRFYDGTQYEININTGELTSIITDGIGFYCDLTNNSRSNILNGQYGVWLVAPDNLQKFNESTQKFVGGYTLNVPESISSNISNDMTMRFNYQGHILFYDNGYTYEVIESEDHIDIVDVTDEYFKTPSFYVNPKFIIGTENELYYLYSYDFYKYDADTETWNTVSSELTKAAPVAYNYAISGEFMIGGLSLDNNIYNITNLGETVQSTSWTDINNVAVDLKSDQAIEGMKTFNNGITAGTVNAQFITAQGSELAITSQSGTINVTSKAFKYNTKNVATTDQCITNKSYTYPGLNYEGVTQVPDPMYYFSNYFKTPSGRVICMNESNAYEFDGTQFTQLLSVTNKFTIVYCGETVTSDGLYVLGGDYKVYKWDDTNSDWIYIIDCPDSRIWTTSTEVRYGDSYKLVNNGGTYEWVSDPVSSLYPGMNINFISTFKIGQTYYYTQENNIYTYDELTKSFSLLGSTASWPESNMWFVFDDCLCYFSVTIHKVDPTADPTTWDVTTDGYYYTSGSIAIEYDNKLFIWNGNEYPNNFGYTYDLIESLPTVPSTDGTYVLKATVLNGQVTYSWVADV